MPFRHPHHQSNPDLDQADNHNLLHEVPDGPITRCHGDYCSSTDKLATWLRTRKIDTVLSFIQPISDSQDNNRSQKTLIDACIKAGVRRFAPSEWGRSVCPLPPIKLQHQNCTC